MHQLLWTNYLSFAVNFLNFSKCSLFIALLHTSYKKLSIGISVSTCSCRQVLSSVEALSAFRPLTLLTPRPKGIRPPLAVGIFVGNMVGYNAVIARTDIIDKGIKNVIDLLARWIEVLYGRPRGPIGLHPTCSLLKSLGIQPCLQA